MTANTCVSLVVLLGGRKPLFGVGREWQVEGGCRMKLRVVVERKGSNIY